MDFTASLVLYNNSKKDIDALLSSLEKIPMKFKLFIVDNSPNDKLKSFFGIQSFETQYFHNPKNNGYVAHNIAIKEAKNLAPYHIVINPDIYFEKDVFPSLVNFMNQNQDIGLTIPKVLYPNGDTQYLCKLLPTPFDFFVRGFLPAALKKQFDKFDLRFTEYNHVMDAPYISGCFMMIRTKVFDEVGIFDERFFMYGEDIDLSRRIHQKWRTVLFPDVFIYHGHERASHQSKKMFFVLLKNTFMYFNKWGWFFDKERRKINRNVLAKIKTFEKK